MKTALILQILFTVFTLQSDVFAQQHAPAAPQIQSVNWKVAIQMAQDAHTRKDTATLILGLKHPVEEVQKQCANALQDLGDPQAVPTLIAAWVANREGHIGPNSVVVQHELDQALMAALVRLTGQTVNTTNPLTFAQMQAVIQVSKDWATQHHLPSS